MNDHCWPLSAYCRSVLLRAADGAWKWPCKLTEDCPSGEQPCHVSSLLSRHSNMSSPHPGRHAISTLSIISIFSVLSTDTEEVWAALPRTGDRCWLVWTLLLLLPALPLHPPHPRQVYGQMWTQTNLRIHLLCFGKQNIGCREWTWRSTATGNGHTMFIISVSVPTSVKLVSTQDCSSL